MGHSTTIFRDAAFTAKDWKMEVWLHLLAREVDRMPEPPEWLIAAGDLWGRQATMPINGCIDAGLDELLTDDEQVAFVRKMAQRVFSSLVDFGKYVPSDFLNNLCRPAPHSRFRQDIETELLLRYGRALLKLLDGKMGDHEYV